MADLTPLRSSPDYRRLWFGNTVSWIGQGMTALAVSLQVYDITGSAFSVGLIGFCSLVPLVVFGLYGGAVADTVDRRKLGLFSASGSFSLAVVLMAATFAGIENVGLLYAIVALQAVCFALNAPARSSMIARLLPPEQLPAANALVLHDQYDRRARRADAGRADRRLVGVPRRVHRRRPHLHRFPLRDVAAALDAARPGGGGAQTGLRTGRAAIPGGRPNLRMTFLSDLCAMVLAHPRALFPVVAIVWYGGDARTTGMLVAAPALGALLGGVFSGWLGRVRLHGLAVLLAVGGWGAAIAVFGLTRHLWLGLLFLAIAGCADTVSMVFRNTMLQAAVPDEMRGRLQGVFIVVVAGGPRLGDFLAGSAAQLTSPAVAVVGGGAACVVAVSLLALKWRGFARYDARDPQP